MPTNPLIRSTRSTQPCIPPELLNRVPASAGVKAAMSPMTMITITEMITIITIMMMMIIIIKF